LESFNQNFIQQKRDSDNHSNILGNMMYSLMQCKLESQLTCIAFCGIIIVSRSLFIFLITAIPADQNKPYS
jgi:hypothetical protein